MPSSVFTRPRARPPLAAVSSQQVFREVHTEDELRAAVAADQIGANAWGSTGRRIVIASPISIKSTIVVTAPGITIESHGKIPISPASDSMTCLFDAYYAINSTFRGLLFTNALNVLDPVSCINPANISTIIDCTFVAGISAISGSASNIKIIGNSFVLFSGTNSVLLSGINNVVSSNMSIGNITITGSQTSISSNLMFGRNIDTSSGAGSNSIVGNIGVGTITNTSTDAVTSNT